MKGSVEAYCGCRDLETKKRLGARCPERGKRRHVTRTAVVRVPSSNGEGKKFKAAGFETVAEAEAVLQRVRDLLELASDQADRERVGDLLLALPKGAPVPEVDDVRRRLGLRAKKLDRSETFGDVWAFWLAGKARSKKPSYANSLEQIGRCWLLPVLADVPIDRVSGESCLAVFNRLWMFNDEIEMAREAGRKPSCPGDVRRRSQHVTVATQHRVFSAMRAFLNWCWKTAHKIPYNPAYMVELEQEIRTPPLVWDPEQVARFLAATADDRLFALWRVALLRGLRRGELAGLRWEDVDLDSRTITVNLALLQVGGKLVWGRPKSRAGERQVSLDGGTVTVLRAWQTQQKRERLAAGEAWTESGAVFTREDGTPLSPDTISSRFVALTAAAGLPRIKFHATRHTAASLALEAGIEPKVVSDQLGHSTINITLDLYTHVRRKVHDDAAEKVATLLPEVADGKSKETGS